MRLLSLSNDGALSLTEFHNNFPSYAILSHTWGRSGEEVTFKDLRDGTGMSKDGYTKILFCGQQAARDGIQYFWVDTCCIDKSSSAELSEAINSMFRWYRNAARCYVYLSDVTAIDIDQNGLIWQSDFEKSKWFTRGWTLQELLAPISVEFFSKEWHRLGDKESLELQIHEITTIDSKAIQGTPLSHFSVADRFSWAENRETTREEDAAYSLLGIFGIYMPLIYGEGKEEAFDRLKRKIIKKTGQTSKGKSPSLEE
jgi:hypothetical protein